MSKYRSREEPVPGSSVSETHPLYWADHIKLVRNITNRWYQDYGPVCSVRRFPQSQPPEHMKQSYAPTRETQRGIYPADQVRPSEPFLTNQMPPEIGHQGLYRVCERDYGDWNCAAGTADFHVLEQRHFPENPRMLFDYPTPGNTQTHHVVDDPVTIYSESFGHHGPQFGQNSSSRELNETYALAHDGTIESCICPYEYAKYHYPSSSVPPVNGCCPGCFRMRCICVPHGPVQEVPPRPGQIYNPSYRDNWCPIDTWGPIQLIRASQDPKTKPGRDCI